LPPTHRCKSNIYQLIIEYRWSEFKLRILAVDPGEKRFGIAISDPTGTIANPLTVIRHVARIIDAAAIAEIAAQHGAEKIIVGLALDADNKPTIQSRSAERLADEIRNQSNLEVILWDESESTRIAQEARIAMGIAKRKRRGHLDDLAATVILQTYLDIHKSNS
jgi:putative holliday junction resolvase